MVVLVGETVRERVTILEGGAPATGKSFTKLVARDPAGADFAVSVTEVGGGVYEIAFVAASAGPWFALFSVNTAPAQYVEVSADVDPGAPQVISGTALVGGITRKELRRQLLRDLGDLVILRATAPGTNVTFIDEARLIGEAGAFRGREVLFTGGTPANLGQVRYVAGSSATARNISFADPLPAATQAGDEAEMVNTRGLGFHLDEVHDAINAAITEIAPQAMVVVAGTTAPFSYGTGLAIPATFATVERVAWQDPDDPDVWHDLPRARRPDGHGWWYDPTTREIKISGTPGRTAHGKTVQLWGGELPGLLAADTDVTTVHPAWLRAEAKAKLLYARFLRMPQPEIERAMAYAMQEARQLRGRAITRRSPHAVRVLP